LEVARNTKKIYQAILHQKRSKGRLKGSWKVGNCSLVKITQDGEGWRSATRVALILLGECKQRKEKVGGGGGEDDDDDKDIVIWQSGYSVQGLAMGWTVRVPNLGRDEIFCAVHPSSYAMGKGFSRG
jgi:hypothetical protein